MKNIDQIARKPELIEIVLDTDEIREAYGDAVIFYMKDFVDINTYFDFYRSQQENTNSLSVILKKIILNAQGEPVIKDGFELPADIAIAALGKINETLGKSGTKPSMSETGKQPA